MKLFDIRTKALLRQLVGHKRPTRRVAFANQGVHLVSFSDDTTVAVWDIPQQTQVRTRPISSEGLSEAMRFIKDFYLNGAVFHIKYVGSFFSVIDSINDTS